jgi:small-conductance mechanosensitive channel
MAEETQTPTASNSEHAELPTSSADVKISLRPTEMEARATVPASEARMLITTFGMSTVGVAGIMGAVLTAYIASSRALDWFLGVSVAELALALAVVLLIARHDGAQHRLAAVTGRGPGSQPLAPESLPLRDPGQC